MWVADLRLLALISSVTTDIMKVLDKTERLPALCLLTVQWEWVSTSGNGGFLRVNVSRWCCSLTWSSRFPQAVGQVPVAYRPFVFNGVICHMSVYNPVGNNLTEINVHCSWIQALKNIHGVPIAWNCTWNNFLYLITYFCTVVLYVLLFVFYIPS